MKRFILASFILLTFISLSAQDKLKNSSIENIKNSGLYFYAEGPASNSEDKAKEKAIQLLYDNITDNIKLSLINLGVEDQDEYLDKIYMTLGVTSDESSRCKIQPVLDGFDDGRYSYFAYLHKKDFDTLCDQRNKDMQHYADRAYNNEHEQKMVEALKNYYWAMMLCVSHPQGANLKLTIDNENHSAYNYLHERVNEVLESFTFAVAKDNPGEFNNEGLAVNLNVRTFGEDVSGLKIEYYNGLDKYLSEVVRNGKAQLQLAATDIKSVDIRLKYDFLHEALSHPEIKLVMDNIDKIVLGNNVKRSIELDKYFPYFKNSKNISLGTSSAELNSLNDKEKGLLAMMQDVESAFRSKTYQSVRKYFTDEAYGMLDTLVRNAKITVVGNQQYEFLDLGDVTICRDIDLKFQYKNNTPFIRELVLRYDENKKLITSLSFRLASDAENDIMTKGRWSKDCRYALINFMEDYQTAYALKRYDYLESIFSDDALIIVGHVLKKTVLPDQKQWNLSENDVRTMEYDKSTYFKNLSNVFNKQDYIDIRFSDTDFTRQMVSDDASKTGGEDIFGIRLLQEYNSTTYGDTGYLFLMVDLRDQKRPVIHVRAWQPDKVDMKHLLGLKDLY